MKSSICLLAVSWVCIISASAQDCVGPGEAYVDLDVNNIKARLLNSGDLWWDGFTGRYIAPNNQVGISRKSAILAGAIWMGALDPNGNLMVSGQTYRTDQSTDYYPGPLGDNGVPIANACQDYDRFWIVDRHQVEEHKADYADDGVIDLEREQIYGWPGTNSGFFEDYSGFPLPEDRSLAPFFDRHNDGRYDPDLGDYPLIKGSQAIWWVFNDNAGPHNVTSSSALKFEVHAMAYAYQSDGNQALDNTTCYEFTVVNRSKDDRRLIHFGLWVDFDLGCFRDDRIGYDSTYQMVYAYNEDADDESPDVACISGVNTYDERIPMVGIKALDSNTFDVSSFMVYDLMSQPSELVPHRDYEYWNCLNGKWSDGTPIASTGNGYDPNSLSTTKLMFTSDPSDEDGWSMCKENLAASRAKALMSSPLEILPPGYSTTISYAVVFVADVPHPCPSLDMLREAVDAACEAILTSTDELDRQELSISVTPNPTNDLVTIAAGASISSITITSLAGQEVRSLSELHSREVVVSLSDMPVGMYTLTIVTDTGSVATRRVVVTK